MTRQLKKGKDKFTRPIQAFLTLEQRHWVDDEKTRLEIEGDAAFVRFLINKDIIRGRML